VKLFTKVIVLLALAWFLATNSTALEFFLGVGDGVGSIIAPIIEMNFTAFLP